MYFPYLRGRQFEMIAIRELIDKGLMSEKIIPIIEPVKLSSTLLKTMNKFIEKESSLIVVRNPQVGSFKKDLLETKKADLSKKYSNILIDDNILKGYIVNDNSKTELESLVEEGLEIENIVSISFKRDALDEYRKSFKNNICKYSLIPDDRKFFRVVKNNKVLFSDKYQKRKRNVDYFDVDEFYSDDHIYFSEEGFDGYSDFSIVGDDYSESGFAPYAVTIHLVYFNEEKELNIIHFVSDSNKDIHDPAGKFYEAVSKLYHWGKDKDINTFGYNELIGHYHNQTYPGLGVVKKLSIMHHIELIAQFFEEVQS